MPEKTNACAAPPAVLERLSEQRHGGLELGPRTTSSSAERAVLACGCVLPTVLASHNRLQQISTL